MACQKVNTITVIAALVASVKFSVSASPMYSQNGIYGGLTLMGATDNKVLYISEPTLTMDFMDSLVIGCPLQFQMSLAAVETPEEVSIIDSYFKITQGNSSDHAWTSGLARIGRIPAHWASTGAQISEYPTEINGPWPSGAGSSPTYAKHNCLTIHRTCVRPPGTPIPGCFPAHTQLFYSLCDQQQRFICEKRI